MDRGRAYLTIGQLIVERPGRVDALARFGLGYCQGRQVLASACAARGLSLDEVLGALEEVGLAKDGPGLSRAVQHLRDAHHDPTREALKELGRMLDLTLERFGDRHASLGRLAGLFGEFRRELEEHMIEEEQTIFPICEALQRGQSPATSGEVSRPIHELFVQHDDCGEVIEQMRAVTGDYTAPADADDTYRALLKGIAALEADLHVHIHEENNILFPMAMKREGELRGEK